MRIALVVAICMSIFSVALADWVPLGPQGGYIYSFAVAPSNQNIIYASPYATPSLIQKSTDGGATWNKAGLMTYYAYAMDVDPTNPSVVYATSFSYIHKSTDGGITWTNTYVTNTYTQAIATHPTNPALVFAAGYTYTGSKWVICLVKTTNSGTNWIPVQIDTVGSLSCAYSLTIDRANPNNICVGGYNYDGTAYYPRVYKSTDGGTTFANISSDLPQNAYYVYGLSVHPTNSSIIYAATSSNGIFRTTSGGSSWTQVAAIGTAYGLSTTQAAPNNVYASGYSYIYKSTDAGATWVQSSTGLSGYNLRNVAAHQTLSNVVYTGDNAGFFRSTNSGTNWLLSTTGMYASSIGAIALARSLPATLYIEFSGIGVYKSTNSGTTWTKCTDFLSCGNICALPIYSNDPNTLIALEGSG